ncbi:MAG TPA: fumarylacetoacetate hydrolase family protein [Oligella sp.]|nr:fumarylacetoacetate hydrolase family protein [Oligella sp.]
MDHQTIAKQLADAAAEAQAVAQFPTEAFNLKEAYDIQRLVVADRVAKGHPICGIKMGFTSRAKMDQMGVHDLIWGLLTSDMLIEDASEVNLEQFVHPRVEPEVCFLIKKDIDRHLTALELVDYIEAVAPALEIIDSRYQNFKFDLNNVVADNCSSAGFVVGNWSRDIDSITNAYVGLSINGRVKQGGSTAGILGNPLRSVVQCSRLLAEREEILPAGSFLMAGAATPAEALSKGDFVEIEVNHLGKASFYVGA